MTNELQLVVMKTRMVKIGRVFNRFPRLIRDLSKEMKKEIIIQLQNAPVGSITFDNIKIIEEIFIRIKK